MTSGDIMAFVSVALGVGSVIGYVVGVKIEQRRDKAKADAELKNSLYNEILNPLNHARACIAEFHRRLSQGASGDIVSVDLAIVADITQQFCNYMSQMFEGIIKHIDTNNLDRMVFTPLVNQMAPIFAIIQDINDTCTQASKLHYNVDDREMPGLTNNLFKLDKLLVVLKSCVDQVMPGWKNII